ncbi:hypothetical protein [Streptomyces clavuligerus]|uniref:hypothetical protein n=1 Tax=Streptomyces clavuligerus TaxID=1901 RepID=UPI00017FF4BB|nr:hypothetical protein [Streptomyces clavuligerus]AXU16811.1 hypothetical protein D1794_29020 [Streptomyces clavuligerus]EDY48780.1 hypothetical protein SSCG_01808 [Streptomyces clavuligerus]MBY6300945.1 hypothetical protein [Streptomyces clavuligerus]QPJ97042.1 hypothetical protein GE265_28435 [Streptomyces clavuligerus]WDN55756.1 hypothetical protein LL058_28060 [Streptomyces clavuligerus]
MTDQPATPSTMTGPQAYALAVEHAHRAARYADGGSPAAARTHAAIATAYAQIATAEATARASAEPGRYPGDGWDTHTDPDRPGIC